METILIQAQVCAPWLIFNIGNNNPVDLMDYIEALENALGKKAEKIFLPLQPGDVPEYICGRQ